MSAEAFAYVAGGAGAEETMRANRRAFQGVSIVPRTLRDVSERDTSVELFGRRLPAPFLLAPIGVLELAHRDADVAAASAAAALGMPAIFSSQASQPMEEVAAAMGAAPRWFQLYWSTEDELVKSFVARAERCGCEAIVITLDTTVLGWRARDLDLGYLPFLRGRGIAQYTSDPVFQRLVRERGRVATAERPTLAAVRTLLELRRNVRGLDPRAAVQTFTEIYSRPSLRWEDLVRIRDLTRLRPCFSREFSTQMTREGPWRLVSTASSCPTTEGDNSTARSRRSRHCLQSSRRWLGECRYCWTAASAVVVTRSKRSQSVRRRFLSAGPTSTGSQSVARLVRARCYRTSLRISTLHLASLGAPRLQTCTT